MEISPLAATTRPKKRRRFSDSFGQDCALGTIKLQRTAPAEGLLHIKGDTRVKRFGVNMEADASRAGLVGVFNRVNRLQLVNRNDAPIVGATDCPQAFEFHMVGARRQSTPTTF